MMLFEYLCCGTVVGLLSGLFGIGGGIVGIPVLLQCFAKQGMPQALSMHMAIGTMLAVVPATTLAAVYRHRKNQLISVDLFKRIAPFLAGGSLVGAIVSSHLNAMWLQRMFAVFLVFAAWRMLLGRKSDDNLNNLQAGAIPLIAAGIGMLSGLLGLGGGVLLVPYLTWSGVPIKSAIATATACILPAALVGSIGFMSMHPTFVQPISWSTGYIYWPAFIGISIMSTAVAPLGATLSFKMATPILRGCFSILLIAVACNLAR